MTTPARGRNGILSVPVAATRKSSKAEVPGRQPPKVGTPRLRLIVRRLAPGLTETEFWVALGEEWKSGLTKIDWAAYKPGKVSKDPSKPSKPSRAYLKVREPQLLDELVAKVKQTEFQDAKNTTKDPCLLGPPSLEFALYTRVPGSRVRHDGRQGTIDQDQEFIDFLQSLTEPVNKPTNDAGAPDGKQDKTTTTPLVQFLKEKKAAKAKETAAAKTAKAKEAKSEKAGKTTVVVKNPPPSAEKARLAKATQDAVKAINKSVASMQGKASPQKTDAKTGSVIPASKESTPPSARPPRERGSAAVANRILQRDLGIAPKEVKTRTARPSGPSKDIEATLKVETSAQNASSQSAQQSAVETAPITPPAAPTGPRNPRPPSAVSVKPSVVPATRPPKQSPQPTPGAKAAFLKHANASQGVTEELLRSAFEAFGPLTRCEIDKKKGFGYVEFAETEHLKLAMQASPVKVGNGQVVVLENKTRKIVPAAAVPTISAKSSGPPADTQPTAQPAAETTSTKSDTAASSGSPSILPTDSTAHAASHTVPPRVPRGAPRGGPTFSRGRSGFAPGRGNFPVQRGAARGNFRGGRGSMRGTLPASGSGTASPSTSVGASTATASATSNTAGATEKT